MSTSSSKHNLAARMAVWSGRHRKKAFWGWLAFVVVVFMAGNMVGTTNISDVDQFSGESHRAEVALDRSGLRPVKESVFIQSDKLTVKDPAFQAAVGDVTDRLSQGSVRRERQVAADRRQRRVSGDGHAALVDFEIAGDSTQAADRVDPTLAAVAAAQAAHPALDIEQLGDASANKAINEVIGEDLAKAGELSLPLTLIILTITFGTLVAAGVPLLIGITAVLAALGLVALPSEILPVDANLPAVILLIGLAVGVDYSLFYLRREREERAAGRSERSALGDRRRDLGARRADLRRDGDRRDGRHVHQRRQVLHLVRRGRDRRGRDRRVRLADGAAGDALLARRPGREGPHPAARAPAPARWAVALLGGAHRAASCAARACRSSSPAGSWSRWRSRRCR